MGFLSSSCSFHCREDESWPAYTSGIYEVDLPEWAYHQAAK